MDFGLKNSVVIVTGASTGIGKATAIAFGAEGARVAITYRSKEQEARATADAIRSAGGEPVVLQFALEDPASGRELVAAVRERWNALHVLVNNAVRWPSGFFSTEDLPLDELEISLRANVVGAVALTKEAIPLMRESGWGRIVNISTQLAVDGNPGSGPYISAKGALQAWSRTLAKEVGPQGILVNVILGGAVQSEARPRPPEMLEMLAESANTGRLTGAEEIARAVVYLGSRANGHVHGEAIRVDGLFVTPPRFETPKPQQQHHR
jgi:3-oxoacyl-[acyl-carrier protein] reductase